MLKKGSALARLSIGIAAIAVIAAACSGSGSSAAPSGGATGNYTIGFANGGGVGNGWREASICSAKAQSADSGKVSGVTVIHHDTDAAGQLADIRDLIAKKVNAIVINPQSPDGAQPGHRRGDAARASRSSRSTRRSPRRAPTTCPTTRPSTPTLAPSRCSSRWAGKGAVVYMRGIAGHPADTDRDTGLQEGPRRVPRHHGRQGDRDQVGPGDGRRPRSMTSSTSGVKFDGIWTSGIDHADRRRAQDRQARRSCRSSARTTRASSQQLINEPGLKGAAVTNPSAVAGAGRRPRPPDPQGREACRDHGPRHPGTVGQHD